MDHRLHQGNARVLGQSGKAGPDDGLAQQFPVLLGRIATSAQSAPRCHDDGCDLSGHVSCHAKVVLRHGFSASWVCRKARAPSCSRTLIQVGIFALQHLRTRRLWLNSMQQGTAA
jgi:hypothetical protein